MVICEWVIKFSNSLPFLDIKFHNKPCDEQLYIGIIFYPHIYNMIYRSQLTLRKKQINEEPTQKSGSTH